MILGASQGIIRPNAGFILPGRRYMEMEAPPAKVGAAGEFKIIKHRQGFVLQETPWFDNLILDVGLNRWATGSIVLGVGIGTGTSTPTVSQVGLDTESHWTTAAGVGAGIAAGISPNYNNTRTVVYRTTLGALNGNYSEVAAGWAAGNNKFSRALILDGGGLPTTIAVGVAEQLDIWYRLSVYPPLVDTTDVRTISGVSYTITGRGTNVNSTTTWSVSMGALNASPGGGGFHRFSPPPNGLGAITSSPAGGNPAVTAESKNYSTYVDGSLLLQQNVSWGLTEANPAGGVQSVVIYHTCWGFQYNFSPVLPKDSTKTLSMSYNTSWARRP